MKKNITVIFVLLLALSWYTSISTYVQTPKEYQEHLDRAAELEKKEIYEDAIQEYESAQSLLQERSQDIDKKIAGDYLSMGEEKDYINTMTTIINSYQDSSEAVVELSEYYENDGQVAKAVNLLKEQNQKKPDDEMISEKLNELKGTYTSVYATYIEMSRIFNGFAVVRGEQGCGIINSNGESQVDAVYDSVGVFGEKVLYAPVEEDGKWYYINDKIHKKLVPDKAYEFLSTYSEGKALACYEGKYGYLDEEMKELCDFGYEDASVFYHEVAAVKKDGKWALINYKFENITDFKFDDVVMDEFRCCSIGERIFVQESGSYHMIDTEGNRVSDETFENAYPFISNDGDAAVARNGKWGFVSRDGKITIDCEYDEAKSFNIDFAPVKQGEEWGYIDTKNQLVIPCEFTDATSFYDDGTAAVKPADQWSMIKLNIYQ